MKPTNLQMLIQYGDNEFDGTQDVNGDLHIVNKTLDDKGDVNFDAYVNDDSYIRFCGSESPEINSELQISKVDIDAVGSRQ